MKEIPTEVNLKGYKPKCEPYVFNELTASVVTSIFQWLKDYCEDNNARLTQMKIAHYRKDQIYKQWKVIVDFVAVDNTELEHENRVMFVKGY